MSEFRIEQLAKHDKSQFDCGNAPLTSYFRSRVSQDVKRRFAACFVAVATETGDVSGFYTLSAGGISVLDLPESLTKKLPRYPSVPAFRVGRLAVSMTQQGRGLGGMLLVDAIRRCLQSEIPAYAVVVDAKDQSAVRFYQHHGFIAFASKSDALFLPFNDTLRKQL